MSSTLFSRRLGVSIIGVVLLVALGGLVWQGYATPENQPTRPSSLSSASAVQPTVTPALPTVTLTATAVTATTTPTPALSSTPGPSPTPLDTATVTPTPTDTLVPTASPTSKPQTDPTAAVTGVGTLMEGIPTPPTEIPSPVPTFDIPPEITNVLLLGSDAGVDRDKTRSDTIIIVAINRSTATASMISIPRDLYVYLPGSIMNKINTATNTGGVDMMKQVILYNFGIPIHYYARVDFEGFKDIFDAVGGIDVNVSCRLRDWRLKSPELDINDEENWEQFTLEPGVHHMDGDLALWYARSRLSTSDFDRGRRQQQLLRAMLNQGVDLGLLSQIPTLWNTFQTTIDTDMDIGRILQLATLASSIRQNGVQHLYLAGKTQAWTVPTTGAAAHLPIWEGENMMQETFHRLFLPPALNRATRAPVTVEIVNASGNPDLAILAADNLAWYGFVPVMGETMAELPADIRTHITYYGPNFKGSYEWLISWIFDKRRSDVELVSEEAFAYNYRVVVGPDYNPCRPALYAPQAFLEQ